MLLCVELLCELLTPLALVTAGTACHHHSPGGLHGRGTQMHQVPLLYASHKMQLMQNLHLT